MNDTNKPTEAVNGLTSAPDRYVGCYVAGKKGDATMFVDLRKDWPKIRFTARWPVIANIDSEKGRPAGHWQAENHSDMLDAEVVLLYAEPTAHLRNAMFEAGAAWAHGKTIYCAGNHPDFENLRGRTRVKFAPSLTKALEAISARSRYDFKE